MRIQRPNLPQIDGPASVDQMRFRLNSLLSSIADQLNGLSEGRVNSVSNAYTAAPTAGAFLRGDFVRNSEPSELGSASSKYVIIGWVCTSAGEPGTWKECRCLTGN